MMILKGEARSRAEPSILYIVYKPIDGLERVKKRFFLQNYVGPAIFKWWRSADAYKESYRRKAINTGLFQQAQNHF